MALRLPRALLLNAGVFLWHCVCYTASEDDPFAFGIGRNSSDKFLEKDFTSKCSDRQSLGGSVSIDGQSFSAFYVCVHGYLSLGDSEEILDQPSELSSSTTTVIVPGLTKLFTKDDIVDYMCDSFVAYYTTKGYMSENSCNFIYNSGPNSNAGDVYKQTLVSSQTISGGYARNLTESWKDIEWDASLFDLNSDDELTVSLTGREEATKYPNLVSNVLYRVVGENDTEEAEVFKQLTGDASLKVKWGFVASWYKVASYYMELDFFNSFQVALGCDDKDTPSDATDDKCLLVFDYFGINWIEDTSTEYMRAGVHVSATGSLHELPHSGTAQFAQLADTSNVDMPGIWVFELVKEADGTVMKNVTVVQETSGTEASNASTADPTGGNSTEAGGDKESHAAIRGLNALVLVAALTLGYI